MHFSISRDCMLIHHIERYYAFSQHTVLPPGERLRHFYWYQQHEHERQERNVQVLCHAHGLRSIFEGGGTKRAGKKLVYPYWGYKPQ